MQYLLSTQLVFHMINIDITKLQ